MQAVVKQLGAGKLAGGGGGVLVNWPQPGAPPDVSEALKSWSPSAQGHVDGYGPGGWSGGFTLAATTYLEDVEPGGGKSLIGDDDLERYRCPFTHAPVRAPRCQVHSRSGRVLIARCIAFS